MTDEVFQAWRRSAARVTLHPAWPVPIELRVVCLGSLHVVLQCIVRACNASDALVHAYNASDTLAELPLVPWTDLPMVDILFSQTVPDIDALDTPACEAARLRYIRTCIHEAMLHELDEFLLVDGRVAAPPHENVETCLRAHEFSAWGGRFKA